MADHRTDQIQDAWLAILRGDNVASANVWRDLPQIQSEEDQQGNREVVVIRQGAEAIVEYFAPNIVDVELVCSLLYVASGKPSIAGGPPTKEINELRKRGTISTLGGGLGPEDFGLSFVILVEEIGCSDVEINEESGIPYASQSQEWRIRYRRNRVDPSA